MRHATQTRSFLLRAAILALSLGLVACAATQVAIQGRFPARYPDAAELHRISVFEFNGRGGRDVSAALQTVLANAVFDNQRHFTLVAADNSGNLSDSDIPAWGRRAGVEAVLAGQADANTRQESYVGARTVCVARNADNNCTRYETVEIPCSRRIVEVTATPRLIRTSDGVVVYTMQRSGAAREQWCQGQSRTIGDDALFASAIQQIAGEIRRDVAPYNAVLNATIKESHEGLPCAIAAQFDQAVAAVQAKNIGEGCRIWREIDAANPNHVWTVYDLGVCAEAEGDYPAAVAQYQRSQQLGAARDAVVTQAIARVNNLMTAEQRLAAAEDQRRAAAEAEAARAAAEQRRTAEAAAARRADLTARWGATMANAVIGGQIIVGMTPAQIRAARGEPDGIERLSPGEEMWHYGSTRVVISQGQVTSVVRR